LLKITYLAGFVTNVRFLEMQTRLFTVRAIRVLRLHFKLMSEPPCIVVQCGVESAIENEASNKLFCFILFPV